MIIISLLGMSGFDTTYRLSPDLPEITTKHLPYAFAQWFPEAKSLILATDGASQSANGMHFRQQMPEAEFVRIPNGSVEDEGWEIFDILSQVIPEGSEVILDMTHGFRTLPMLSFMCLSYLRIAKGVKIKAMYYGAFDAKDERGVAPIFDLTPFISLLDWAQAAKRFEDTGDASLFTPLLKMNRAATFNAVSRQLTCLSETLSANRGRKIGEEAAKLQKVIQVAEQQGGLEKHQRPFALILEQLKAQTAPLAHPDNDLVLTLQAQHAQICWYAERGHYPQAAALAREWMISVRQWREHKHISLDEDKREHINDDCKTAIKRALEKQEGKFYIQRDANNQVILEELPIYLWKYAWALSAIANLRNDLMHFGFKQDASNAKSMKQRVQDILLSLPAALAPLGLPLDNDDKAAQ